MDEALDAGWGAPHGPGLAAQFMDEMGFQVGLRVRSKLKLKYMTSFGRMKLQICLRMRQ